MDKLEADFDAALQRLRAGVPIHPELQEQLHEGKLRTNKSSVALEAGHSRTKLYDYPDVLAKLETSKHPSHGTKTAKEVIDDLRKENALLREEKKLALSQLAAMAIRMAQLEAEHAQISRLLARLKEREGQSVNRVIDSPLENNIIRIADIVHPSDDGEKGV